MKSGLSSVRRMIAVVGVALGVAAVPAAAQDAKPYTKGTVLIVDTVALEKMMPDAKDGALVRAMGMIPARVKELPREVPDMPAEAAGVINAVMSCIGKPARVTVSYDGDLPSGGLFGYGIGLSFLIGDEAVAGEVHKTVSSLMAETGQRIKTSGTRWKGMSDIQAGVGVVSFGPRQAKDGWRYEVVFGTMNNADGAVEVLPSIEGVEPLIRARMDFSGLTPLRDIANQMGGGEPMIAEVVQGLAEMGLVGENAVKINYVAGVTKDESVSVSTWEGVKRFAETLHMSKRPLTGAEFAAVPSDATDVFMARMGEDGFGYLLDSLAQLGDEGAEFLDQFKEHTGVDLQADLLDAVGGTGVVYMSDSTGGGGMMSAVAMMSFRDRAKAAAALNKIAGMANEAVQDIPMPAPYIKVSSWKDGETDLMTLRFPGLPIPLEITLAMTKDWLILAPIPQGAVAAARQASGKGDAGLTANASFKSRLPEGKEFMSVTFSDTPRTLRDGYAAVSMVGSAVANLVRSPHGEDREPGLVVPLYHELAKGVKAKVSYSYWRGEDLVNETRSDRSGLVGAAGMMAFLTKIAPAIVLPAAAAFGAIEESGLMAVDVREYSGRAITRVALRSMPMGTLGAEQMLMLLVPSQLVDRGFKTELKGIE